MTKPRHLTITIPEPCTVPWNSMSRVDEYRSHCASCATVVIDFSEMTEAEIVSYMQERAGQKSCGRFRQSQLNRPMPLIPQKKQKAVWWKAAVLLPFTLWSKNSSAQNNTLTTGQRDSVLAVNTQRIAIETDTSVSIPDTTLVAETDTAKMLLPDSVKAPLICTIKPFNLHELVWTISTETLISGCTSTTYGLWVSVPENISTEPLAIKLTGILTDTLSRIKDTFASIVSNENRANAQPPSSAPEPAKPQPAQLPSTEIAAITPPERPRIPRR
ncbi:MAG: hypothetical protein MUC87_09510 [Bacteroidia bacterium]|jgi:hypothetical protein|nr:hypothetical protein [Bacteroidia bacterium]